MLKVKPSIARVVTPSGAGSGVCAGKKVITAAHVMQGNGAATVILHTGDELPARTAAVDKGRDLAVLEVSKPTSPPPWGDVNSIQEGDECFTVGFPMGMADSPAVTGGRISRIMLDDDGDIELIQVDAPVNPGCSGGALCTAEGDVIGIISSKVESFGGRPVEGVAFAVPIDKALRMLNL